MKKILIYFGTLLSLSLLIVVTVSHSKLSAQKQSSEEQIKRETPHDKALVIGKVFYPNSTDTVTDALISANKQYSEGPAQGRIPSSGSDKDGNYRFELTPGIYQICAWKQSENYLLPEVLAFGLPTGGKCVEVTASIGEVKKADLMLSPKSHSLRGKITGLSEKILNSGVRVVVYRPLKLVNEQWELVAPEDATWEPKAEAEIDSDGQFTVNGLPSGTYFLRLEKSDGVKLFFKSSRAKLTEIPIEIGADKSNKIKFSANQFF